MKRLTAVVFCALFYQVANAQNDVDALRYSYLKSGFTAKSLALGGAVGALGGDISVMGINPASMAQYKSGEAVISLGFNNISNSSLYLQNNRTENLYKVNLPSVGLVFTQRKIEKGKPVTQGWVNANFGMSFGRVADFNRIISYSGTNPNNSLLDYFAERSNGIPPNVLQASNDEFDYGFKDDETMAWESYLIDPQGNNTYVAHIDPMHRNITQKGVINSSGSMNEINLSTAGNYSNKLYTGGTLNIKTVKYSENNRLTEWNDPNSSLGWNTFTYEKSYSTSGTGVTGILGMVYRFNDNLRIGLSYTTPTNLKLDDEYNSSLKTQFDTTSYNFHSVKGYYSYQIQTPSKTTFSAAYIFGKKGFVSADFDAINYTNMRLRPSIDAFDIANDVIRSKYNVAYNMRVGGEIVQDVFRFRAGYAYYGNPFRNNSSTLNSQSFSGGFGIKEKNWSLDLGLIKSITKDQYQPYVLNKESVPVSENTWNTGRIMLTFAGSF